MCPRLLKRQFGQKAFGQMVFRSNGLSVKRCPAKWRSINRLFGQKTFGQKKSVKLIFGKVIQNRVLTQYIKILVENFLV
jgi:hypothetical protein